MNGAKQFYFYNQRIMYWDWRTNGGMKPGNWRFGFLRGSEFRFLWDFQNRISGFFFSYLLKKFVKEKLKFDEVLN